MHSTVPAAGFPGSQEAILRQVRRLSYLYELQLADIQPCPGGYLINLQRCRRSLRFESSGKRHHLLLEVALDDEGTCALIPHLEGWDRYITPPKAIAVCHQFSQAETAAFMRQKVIGPVLSNGLGASDQLFLHITEASDALNLEEAEPNSLGPNTYAELQYGYRFRTSSEVFDYLNLELPADPWQPVVTQLGGTYLHKPIPGYGDYLVSLVLLPRDAEVTGIFCGDDEAERAIRDLRRWQKSMTPKRRATSR